MGKGQPDKQIGYLLRSYPRLSQTFILNEILALEQAGVPLQIFALTNPQEKIVQPQVRQVRAPVRYLDDAARPRPLRTMLRENIGVARRYLRGYFRSLFYVAAHREIDQGYTASNRWICFLQAVHFTYLLTLQEQIAGKKPDHLHAHFAHDPTLIVYLVHLVTALPFSFTAHARDLYQVSEKALLDRIHRASAVITCCRANLDYLNRIASSQSSKFSLVYHGVNLTEFQPVAGPGAAYDLACPLILSVGRLVEKKGFQDLLEALLIVKRKGARFRCVIYGDGPLREPLQIWIREHNLAGEVVLNGDRSQQELIAEFQSAALFILTPFETQDGDRDGIPNVLLEAMAVGLPVITTAVAGIPELIEDNQNGLLCQPHDVEAISSGILELLRSADKRAQLGEAALKTVREQFDISRSANHLKALFA